MKTDKSGRVRPKEQIHPDDIQKGRWGGLAKKAGRLLRAVYMGGDDSNFDFVLVVESMDDTPLLGPVHFHLHDSFDPMTYSVQDITYRDRYAVLDDCWAYETFTAAVEVMDGNGHWISLELDLEEVPEIPDFYKPLRANIQAAGKEIEATTPLRANALQVMLTNNEIIKTPVEWRSKWEAVESCVCRVLLDDIAHGTGVLIGRDLVLTNWHVVHRAKDSSGERISFQFGYMIGKRTFRPKIRKARSDDWLRDWSPPTDLEWQGKLGGADPTDDELDFALIELSPADDDRAANRQYPIIYQSLLLGEGDGLIILQHPDGDPQACAIDTDAVLGFNDRGNRIRYATNTRSGASGSPCFDMSWRLVALHHSGWPHRLNSDGFNQGIPISALYPRISRILNLE